VKSDSGLKGSWRLIKTDVLALQIEASRVKAPVKKLQVVGVFQTNQLVSKWLVDHIYQRGQPIHLFSILFWVLAYFFKVLISCNDRIFSLLKRLGMRELHIIFNQFHGCDQFFSAFKFELFFRV
jgi:hypothetical protein